MEGPAQGSGRVTISLEVHVDMALEDMFSDEYSGGAELTIGLDGLRG